MKEGILTVFCNILILFVFFLCRVKMSETNQQKDELPAYLKDEPPAGTASYADIFIVKGTWNSYSFLQQSSFLS